MSNQVHNQVISPNYYHREGADFECFELSMLFPHPLARAIEYVFRYENKNGIKDLEKAEWWMQKCMGNEICATWTVEKTVKNFSMCYFLSITTSGKESLFWKDLCEYVEIDDRKLKIRILVSMLKNVQNLIEEVENELYAYCRC